jgi:hypothetical protein
VEKKERGHEHQRGMLPFTSGKKKALQCALLAVHAIKINTCE